MLLSSLPRGETGELIRAVDWARTPIGPPETWPAALRTMVAVMLGSRHPMFLWWGPGLVQFYNDAYLPSFGAGKHPAAMGQAGRDCWPEIWPIIGPQIDDVMQHGRASWNQDQLVPIARNGRLEEVYWSYGYSPVPNDDGSIGGTLVVCTETTSRVTAERRMLILRELNEAVVLADGPSAVVARACAALAPHAADLPFALLYTQALGAGPVLAGTAGLTAATAAAIDRALRPALATAVEASARPAAGGADLIDVGALVPAVALPGGPWPEPARHVLVVPWRIGERSDGGILVAAISPRLPFDERYRALIVHVADGLTRGFQRLDAWQVRLTVERERNDLLMQAPVATALLVGPDHIFLLANRLYQEVVGRTELLGKTYREAFPEVAGTTLYQIVDGVYQTGQPYMAEEFLVPLDRTGTGVVEERFFKFNLEAMRDARGQVYGMMVIAVDITEQVRARKLLERNQAEREALLTQLEGASRAKDEFLAMLGHELRNPLSPIVTALEIMRLRDAPPPREIDVIERQVRHLTRLVDDLLDVSRIARGHIELRRERMELGPIIARAIETASPLLEGARHTLTVQVAATGLAVDADPTRIEQIVANLLTNAAKYTPAGGQIALAARRDDAEVVIEVRDNGVGIAAEVLPHVFDRFVQVAQDAARSRGGLGLGLAIVKNLVALHGGDVTGASDGRGRGATFTVRLPAAVGPAPAVIDRTTPAAGVTLAPLRIVVVDDNLDAAESLAEALQLLGHEVALAHDGPSGLRAIGEQVPAVALLDLGLPVMDGYQLARALRADPRLAGLALVAVSGYGTDDDRARTRAAGFDAHLVKPVSLADLRATLTKLSK